MIGRTEWEMNSVIFFFSSLNLRFRLLLRKNTNGTQRRKKGREINEHSVTERSQVKLEA